MFEAELAYLRRYEGEALRETAKSGDLKGLISEDNAYVVGVEFLNVLVNSIESRASIDASLFRAPLFKAFFQIGLNKSYLEKFVDVLFAGIIEFVQLDLKYNEELVVLIRKYEATVKASISEYSYISKDYSLSGVDTYRTSKTSNRVAPLTRKTSNRTIQTLFPYSRYWYPISERSERYSPFQMNKSIVTYVPISKHKGVFNLSYEESVVYKNVIYISKPGIKPSEDKFLESDWDLYIPKRFNQSKSFNKTYSTLLEGVFLTISESSSEINSITSDSKVETYAPKNGGAVDDLDLLTNTFGGAGRSVYKSLVELRLLSGYMGGHEGSTVGAVDYVSKFNELLNFVATGELSNRLRQEGYGNFNTAFPLSSDSIGYTQTVNGLRFLEKFSGLRSFLHNMSLPGDIDITTDRILFNPLYAKYSNNIQPNYSIRVYKKSEDDMDFISQSLSILVERCKYFGDKLERISGSLDRYGRLPGYEALGSISLQIAEFQKSFPPVDYLNKVEKSAGVTGCAIALASSYARISETLNPFSLPPSIFSETLEWMKVVLSNLEEVKYELEALGIRNNGSGFLPNISNKKFVVNNTDIFKYLSFLGFTDSEINQVIDVKSFPEFVTKFAPFSDSADLSSFFKGFELSQMIYEFSGDKGIEAYLNFLYKKSSIESLLNILYFTDQNKSDQTYLRISKYPRLVALLLGLTYAVDPDQINKFLLLLGNNNTELLEAITILLQKGQNTIIKKKEDIKLVDALVGQMVRGYYSEDVFSSPDISYADAKATAPLALRNWTSLIDQSLGNVEDPESLAGFYDKSVGLTLKELIVLLNNPSPTSGVAQIIDNYYGGDFSKILKYANISGLAIKLGYYKNSSQVDNAWVDFDRSYYGMPSVLDTLTKVMECMSLTVKLIESSINSDWSGKYYNKPNLVDTIINSQNKPPEAMLHIVANQYSSSKSEISDFVSKVTPQEPPGIGNSRLPNRVSVMNSITPEQASVISTTSLPGVITSTVEFSANSLINNFIKVTERNMILNHISQPTESNALYGGVQKFGSINDPARVSTVAKLSDKDVSLYKQLKGQSVVTSGSGRNYIEDPLKGYEDKLLAKLPESLLSRFDPKTSCKKFGGADCDKIYDDDKRCVGYLNKSLLPESYDLQPMNNGVIVDRPLGFFSEYLPSDGDLINSKIPSYYSLLENPKPGRNSEPIVDGTVIKPSGALGDLIEYGNTQSAILAFIKSSKKEYTELTCASLNSITDYQLCMNLLKCKKFKTDNVEGETFLRFCPPGTSGGI